MGSGNVQIVHLRYLQTIARAGSLSAAARALGVSQPALTGAVQRLEEQLGAQLLHRNRDGVALTEAGDTLLRHAVDILSAFERMELEVRGTQEELKGRFTLGCHDSLGAYFLPGFMRSFLAEAPGLELTLWNGSSAEVRDAVLDREIHYGLIVNPLAHPDLVLVRLFPDAMDFFVNAEEPLVPGIPEAHARLLRGPLLYAGRVAQCQELLRTLAGEQVLPPRMLSCGDLELVKSLTLGGLGVGVLPRRVAAYGHPGKLRRLHPGLPNIPDLIYLAWRADLPRMRGATVLKDALVRYGRTLDEGTP